MFFYFRYVSHELLIYVLDVDRKKIAEQMCQMLAKRQNYSQLKKKPSIEWKVGDICFAPYKQYGLFRAVVKKINYKLRHCSVSSYRIFYFEIKSNLSYDLFNILIVAFVFNLGSLC